MSWFHKEKKVEQVSPLDVNKFINVANSIKFYQEEIGNLKKEIAQLKQDKRLLEDVKIQLERKIIKIKEII